MCRGKGELANSSMMRSPDRTLYHPPNQGCKETNETKPGGLGISIRHHEASLIMVIIFSSTSEAVSASAGESDKAERRALGFAMAILVWPDSV